VKIADDYYQNLLGGRAIIALFNYSGQSRKAMTKQNFQINICLENLAKSI
tara:strand:- start:342 stop:491 length:150 start_codon:yes stop_codon:yes gene_type:complete